MKKLKLKGIEFTAISFEEVQNNNSLIDCDTIALIIKKRNGFTIRATKDNYITIWPGGDVSVGDKTYIELFKK